MARINGSSAKNNYGFYALLTETLGTNYLNTNTTTVKYEVYIVNVNARTESGNWTFNAKIDGSNVYNKTGQTLKTNDTDYNKPKLVFSGSKDVKHENNGSKKITFSASLTKSTAYSLYDPGKCSLSGNFTLTTIPRASTIEAVSGYIGETTTLYIGRKSDSFTEKLTWSCEKLSGTIENLNNETNVPFTIPTSLYALIPNDKQIDVTISCITYNGTTQVGEEQTTTLTARVDETKNKPIINEPVITETNTKVSNLTNKLVLNASRPKITINASGQNGASIKSIITTNEDGQSYSGDDVVFNTIGTAKFTIDVTDTRDLPNSKQIDKTEESIPYVQPNIKTISIDRLSQTSGEIILSLIGSFYKGYIDNTENELNISYRYKENVTDATWSDLIRVPNNSIDFDTTNNSYSLTNFSLGQITQYNKQYVFEIYYSDVLVTDAKPLTRAVKKGVPTFDYGEHDLKVNGDLFVADEDGLNKINILNKIKELQSGDIDLSDYATKKELEDYAKSADLSTVATTGKYYDLLDEPTKISSFENDKGYQTASQVNTLIGNAIADIEGISYQVVTSLPSTGEVGVIYLVSNSGSNPNIYDEYIYANGKFEKIGTTDVDLTNYALKSQIPTKVSQLTNDSGYLTSVPEQVFYWDGQSGSTTPTNIALFQQIYDAWVANKEIVVLAKISDKKTVILSEVYIEDEKFTLNYTDTYALKSDILGISSIYSDVYSGEATIRNNQVSLVNTLKKTTYTIDPIETETDPVFKASASYGITSTNISNWNGKQEKLVSGTNIKTINGTTILGSGDINIPSGKDGVGIDTITNYYLASENSGASSSNEFELHQWDGNTTGREVFETEIDMGLAYFYKYSNQVFDLENLEGREITFNSLDNSQTQTHILDTVEDLTGDNKVSAIGILLYGMMFIPLMIVIKEPTSDYPYSTGFYLLYSEDMDMYTSKFYAPTQGITTDTEGWTETPQTITSTKKYLWNYEKITYTDNTSFTSEPHIIGVYGDTGPQGPQGEKGEDGVGIASVEQTTTSTEDGGTNIITVTKTDGTTSTFSVKNGSAGSSGSGGTVVATDVRVNGTSITSNGVANLVTQSAYNSSTNKIATKNDIPTNNNQLTNGAGYITGISKSDVTTALGYTPYNSTNPNGYTSNTGTITGVSANGTSIATSGVANIPPATTTRYGVTLLSNSTSSTSTSLAATPSAVKSAYDLASTANTQANANKTAISNNATAIAENETAITNLLDNLFYKAGESYSFEASSTPASLWLGGTFTTSRTQIAFTIFTPKNMKYINSIACEKIDLTVRSNLGGYIANSVTDKSKVTTYKSHDNAITLIYTLDKAVETSIATNNTPASICLKSITLSFN